MNANIVDMARVNSACARVLGAAPTVLTPDAIAAMRPSVEWKALPDWKSMRDEEIAAESGLCGIGFYGRMFVLTEFSFISNKGAFYVDARDMAALVSEHLSRYGECFFNGDVVVVESEGRRIWLFHHEGVYATIL